jgi:hypothetical protein
MTLHFDESIMIGTRAMSGSDAIRFKKRTMAAWLSSMASSMLMSMICAPLSTCWRATAKACSNSPLRIMRANALDPVTLVRSPMFTNRLPAPMLTGSRPDSFIGGVAENGWVAVMAYLVSGLTPCGCQKGVRASVVGGGPFCGQFLPKPDKMAVYGCFAATLLGLA